MKDSAQCPERPGTSGGCEEGLETLPRRKFMRGVSAAAAAATLAPLLGTITSRSARAASDKEVVMSTSGGSFMQTWQTKIIDPFQKQTGLRVKQVSGSMKAHAMQLRASRGTPPFDLFMGDGADFVNLAEGGFMLPLL